MAVLHLTHREVEAVLRDIEVAIKTSNSIMEELDEVMVRLGACWEGETFYSYLAAYRRYRENVQEQFNLLMRGYQKAYDEAIQAVLIAPMPPLPPMNFGF